MLSVNKVLKSNLIIIDLFRTRKNLNHVDDIPEMIDGIHFYNYFMNAFIELQSD